MNELKFLNPDRWLVCSPAVERAIRLNWADPSAPAGLAALRLSHPGQVQLIPPERVESTVRRMAVAGCGAIRVIVESMGTAELELDETLEALADEIGHDLELLVWREEPADIMASLASPEGAVVEAWKANRSMPRGFEVTGHWPAGWREDYLRALEAWAAAARLQYPDETAHWLLVSADATGRPDTSLGTDALSAALLPARDPREEADASEEASNDWSWTEIALGGLAANTPMDEYAAMRRVPVTGSDGRWSLSRYPIVGQKAVYLMFEADSGSVGQYVGCLIRVCAEGRILDLGKVNLDGVAELRLEGTVDISLATVSIGRRGSTA